MARKLKTKATTGVKAVTRRKARSITRVPVESAHLIQVGPTDPAWQPPRKAEPAWLPQCPSPALAKGAIVKLVPPPGTPESHVIAMERGFYDAEATSVKVMPVQEELRITVEGETFDFNTDDDERPLRQVAMERCDRVTNAHDVDALKDLVAEAMDHAEGQ